MTAATANRAIKVPGLVNGRDLGGLPRQAGGLTPFGVFYRSESVDRVDQAGWDALRAKGIRTVIDLRQPIERERDVSRRPDWITSVQVDLDGLENARFWADYWDNGKVATALYYLPHLVAMPERAGAVLAAVADAPAGGVLFHCESGRDRTGLVAMLLLAAVDAEPDAIVGDYLETVLLADARAAASGRPNTEAELDALCRSFGSTTEEAFRTALRGLDITDLLERAALTPNEVRSVRTWRGALAL
jgi:protein tyrosine/serine phosphatase